MRSHHNQRVNLDLLVKRLPHLELSYEKIIHKKVYSDLFLLIPNGIRSLCWFTYFKGDNICVLLHLNKNNEMVKKTLILSSFDRKLSYGTILYGNYLNINNKNYFTCEDIFYYKGKDISTYQYIKKLDILKKIFNDEIKQVSYTDKFTTFTLPFISNNYMQVRNQINEINYPVHAINFRNLYSNQNVGIQIIKNNNRQIEAIFLIKAQIKFDIYSLYCLNSKKNNTEYYNLAYIPNYKTSVMMNKHFRKIRENTNLDLLEESESEDDFENPDIEKYVDLNKSLYFKCVFLRKFSKWQPIECLTNNINNNNLSTAYELSNMVRS